MNLLTSVALLWALTSRAASLRRCACATPLEPCPRDLQVITPTCGQTEDGHVCLFFNQCTLGTCIPLPMEYCRGVPHSSYIEDY